MLVGWVLIDMVGAAYHMQNDDVVVIIHLRYMVTMSLTTTWPGSVVGSFVTLRPWCVPIVVFRGRWSSCTGDVGASRRPPTGG